MYFRRIGVGRFLSSVALDFPYINNRYCLGRSVVNRIRLGYRA